MRFLACYVGIIKCPANPNPHQNQTTVDAVLRLKGTLCDVLQNCHESHYLHILDMYFFLHITLPATRNCILPTESHHRTWYLELLHKSFKILLDSKRGDIRPNRE